MCAQAVCYFGYMCALDGYLALFLARVGGGQLAHFLFHLILWEVCKKLRNELWCGWKKHHQKPLVAKCCYKTACSLSLSPFFPPSLPLSLAPPPPSVCVCLCVSAAVVRKWACPSQVTLLPAANFRYLQWCWPTPEGPVLCLASFIHWLWSASALAYVGSLLHCVVDTGP